MDWHAIKINESKHEEKTLKYRMKQFAFKVDLNGKDFLF